MILLEILFWIFLLLIFHAVIGYPASLYIINKLVKKKNNYTDISLRPTVTIIIPVHNEETVIENKLKNLTSLNYPKEYLEIIISSDNSNDRTNQIVQDFQENFPEYNIRLYIVEKRMGKTNAQNEAVEIANGEILVFSDANAILDKDAIIHLVSSFTDNEVIYVTGKLAYINSLDSSTSEAENRYWNYDLFMRKVESNTKTITAGNGAIYAIKKSEYVNFEPIKSHDSAMPTYAALNHKKALFNEKAIAYEKAGETSEDEFKRKVRMFRGGIESVYRDFKKYNLFEYGWFSYFYFGHRALRRLLFILHLILFLSNSIIIGEHLIYICTFILQILFYLLALTKKLFNFENKIFHFPYYYSLTLIAQLIGTYNKFTGKSKPFWEKAESTR